MILLCPLHLGHEVEDSQGSGALTLHNYTRVPQALEHLFPLLTNTHSLFPHFPISGSKRCSRFRSQGYTPQWVADLSCGSSNAPAFPLPVFQRKARFSMFKEVWGGNLKLLNALLTGTFHKKFHYLWLTFLLKKI